MREDKKWLDEDWLKKRTIEEFREDTELYHFFGPFDSDMYVVHHPRGTSNVIVGLDPRYKKIAAQIHMELSDGETRDCQIWTSDRHTKEEQEMDVLALVWGVATNTLEGITSSKDGVRKYL